MLAVFVKVCGITSEEDALLAVAMGADAVGFNFCPSSPRQITVPRARDIAGRLPAEILTVGIFRDESPDRVVAKVHEASLRAAQLHGHESAEHSLWVSERVPVLIKAFPAGSPDIASWESFGADAILIDSPRPGSGEIFDWSLAEGAPKGQRVILAGGLTPANVAQAIEQVQPWGVDAATGLEVDGDRLGRKDPRKIRAFVANARAAEPDGYAGDDDMPYDWTSE